MEIQTTLIIGANSGIAKALARKMTTHDNQKIVLVSRNLDYYQQTMFASSQQILIENYDEESIKSALQQLHKIQHAPITQVFICLGVLHTATIKPEKALSQFSAKSMMSVMNSNALTPLIWLQHLIPQVASKQAVKITFFSARVGSIRDNKLGGWYSYRASKAALNMLLKSASIELGRSNKNIKLISFHPGTTDTPLSQPFQKNVPAEKLFSTDFVAEQLLQLVEKIEVDGQLSFIDWQGKEIPW
ncbi:short-chain dehydrogenase [Psychromonas sp. psych-6C06]|uniref:SDR family NAD(P)-dependent oxidoreductase n=1 Tax=Psychromonas sp. psych-6C06 TaxID=2058089 RepID=UPI000C32B99A|nr:SDR family NAD(P)-dependent oxidoreductase [Psychromonas sp. psych-6C06]PKF62657.1 short-chain dehydrogenase [Psychromonas sp. psych-6C06]